MSNNSIVSVIIPCYNHGKYLKRSIESVLAQDTDAWELIIVNDGSTDNTSQVIESYICKNEWWDKIRLITQENGGASKARNEACKIAKGQYLLFLDADDWIQCNYVSEGLAHLNNNSSCSVFRPTVQWHNEKTGRYGLEHNYSGYKNMLLYGQNIQFIIRKDDWLKVGGFDETMKNGIEDWEFCIRLLYGDKTVYNSPLVLYHYQRFSSQGSLSQSAGKRQDEILWYIYQKHQDIYREYFGNPILLARHKEAYAWADRRLPQLAKKIQIFWQWIVECIR